MPTITQQGRVNIGGSEESAPPRRVQVTAPTGMNLPRISGEAPPAAPAASSAQAPKVGHPDSTEETAPPAAVTLSPQLTALAKKQQKLQQEIQAQRDKEATWEREKADYVPKTSFKSKFEQSPLDALKDLGLTYEQFNEGVMAQLNGADPVKELRSELEQVKKSQEDSTNRQYEATLKQYRVETDTLIGKDPKAFHLIKKGGHEDAVVQHIVDTWKDDPDQVLTVDQAAKEVEEILREHARAAAASLKELDPPAEETAQPTKKTLPPPTAAAPRTLTQRVEAPPQARTPGQFQHLSMKERIAQAVARAQR